MKYCTHCGKELLDEAVICVGCGCAVESAAVPTVSKKEEIEVDALVRKLSERVKTESIIWLVIGILQVLGGIFIDWFVAIVGVLNIISSVMDMKFSKTVLENPQGIVKRYEPLGGPIITLVYNLVIGGIIGVAGSIYYFVAVRNFVMENKEKFAQLDVAEEQQ